MSVLCRAQPLRPRLSGRPQLIFDQVSFASAPGRLVLKQEAAMALFGKWDAGGTARRSDFSRERVRRNLSGFVCCPRTNRNAWSDANCPKEC